MDNYELEFVVNYFFKNDSWDIVSLASRLGDYNKYFFDCFYMQPSALNILWYDVVDDYIDNAPIVRMDELNKYLFWFAPTEDKSVFLRTYYDLKDHKELMEDIYKIEPKWKGIYTFKDIENPAHRYLFKIEDI